MNKKIFSSSFSSANAFLLIFSLLGYLLLFPQTAAESARNGLLLWYHSVLPVIFPFLFLSSVMIRLIRAEDLPGALTHPFMRLFGCSPYEAFVILAGFLCGLPVGAKLTSNLYQEKKISRKEALHMIGFVNNLSPGFLLSYVSVEQMQLSRFAWCIPVSVLGAALLSGRIDALFCTSHLTFSASAKNHGRNRNNGRSRIQKLSEEADATGSQQSGQTPKHAPALGDVLDNCISDAVESALRLCAYILLFAILSGALIQAAPITNPIVLFLVSSIEVTNGIRLLAQSSLPFAIKYLSISALAAFGGFSALAQSIGIAHMDAEFLAHYIKSRVKITLLAILFAAVTLLLQNNIPQ